MIRKTLAALELPTVAGTVVIDVATYDAFPALSVMEETYVPMCLFPALLQTN